MSEGYRAGKVTGIDIPFWDLVRLMIKLALAAIPATLILTLVFLVLYPVVAVALLVISGAT